MFVVENGTPPSNHEQGVWPFVCLHAHGIIRTLMTASHINIKSLYYDAILICISQKNS